MATKGLAKRTRNREVKPAAGTGRQVGPASKRHTVNIRQSRELTVRVLDWPLQKSRQKGGTCHEDRWPTGSRVQAIELESCPGLMPRGHGDWQEQAPSCPRRQLSSHDETRTEERGQFNSYPKHPAAHGATVSLEASTSDAVGWSFIISSQNGLHLREEEE